jgi:hypothetical protein
VQPHGGTIKTSNEKLRDRFQRCADTSFTLGLGYLMLSDRSIHSSNVMAWTFVGIGSLATVVIQLIGRQRAGAGAA